MTHVPETGAGKNGVDLWRPFLEGVSWVLDDILVTWRSRHKCLGTELL